MKKEEFKRKNRGITLIALIITIIILLILAGIAISQLTGNSILNKSKYAKDITEYSSAKEIIDLKLIEIRTTCIQENKEYTIQEIASNCLSCKTKPCRKRMPT